MTHGLVEDSVVDGQGEGMVAVEAEAVAREGLDEGLDAALDIAVLVASEVTCAGLEALLSRLPAVGRVRVIPLDAEVLPERIRPADVLIVAAEQWSMLESCTDVSGLPSTLVLGDDLYERWNGDLSSLPVDGFLSLKELSVQTLDDALKRVTVGEMPIPSSLAKRLLTGSRGTASAPGVIPLTSRENQAFVLLAKGLSNKQIARSLGISVHGAKRLVGSILLKLGASNRTSAVVTGMKSGLL
ncbi:LuxR C-terminal-related transcriptional regulator [Streptomyces sp. DT2A-34]|uniref:helix-turn-helix transcriptional regulator n=1 Tax=Streptomyces sp. DT2A-34 TaxID=3051182 RepID=UPI00265C3648|nr:LuxR C-terminal-related transcriptional regulator [Streptomyces sp. DT2A-34]MDO0912045.1 LuxR C-terminal-related transcriptional regulator [Streptomyces sp. DT2A-34]